MFSTGEIIIELRLFESVDSWVGEKQRISIRKRNYETIDGFTLIMDNEIKLEIDKEYVLFLNEEDGSYFPGLSKYAIYEFQSFSGSLYAMPTSPSRSITTYKDGGFKDII